MRRMENGAMSGVECLGKRLTLPTPKPSTNAAPPDNPYVVGRALHDRKSFYGREEQIEAIVRGLIGQQQDNVVLVLGERRIGKTTLLYHLQEHDRIKRRYIVAYQDMESAGDFDDTATFYREYLIRPIRWQLQAAGLEGVPQSGQAALAGFAHAAFERFMAEVDERLASTDRRLLVILDELEKVLEEGERPRKVQKVQLPKEVLAAIRSVLLASKRISFVLAGVTDVVRRHIQHPDNRLFNLVVEVELCRALFEYEEQLILDLETLAQQVPSLLRRARNDKRRYHIAIGLFARHRQLLQQAEHSLLL